MSRTRRSLLTRRTGKQEIAIWLIAAATALLPGITLADTGVGVADGFLSGFTHPRCAPSAAGSPRSGS